MRATTTCSALLLTLMLGVDAGAAPRTKGGHVAAGARLHKKVRHREPAFTGYQPTRFRTEPLPLPSGDLKLTSVNFKGETVDVNIYNDDGSFDEDALDQLYHLWRCRRTGTEKPIDPHLFEILSMIYDHFQTPIELVSGFRNQEHTTSFHFHGSASDIRVSGVSDRALHEFVVGLDGGHMGIGRYPRAGFVHVDVRPQSYRWIDRSPPSENMGHPKRRHNT